MNAIGSFNEHVNNVPGGLDFVLWLGKENVKVVFEGNQHKHVSTLLLELGQNNE